MIVIVANNGRYGTIRMHQERHYPGRVSGTDLFSPDFPEAIIEACPPDGACGLADIWVYDPARNALGVRFTARSS